MVDFQVTAGNGFSELCQWLPVNCHFLDHSLPHLSLWFVDMLTKISSAIKVSRIYSFRPNRELPHAVCLRRHPNSAAILCRFIGSRHLLRYRRVLDVVQVLRTAKEAEDGQPCDFHVEKDFDALHSIGTGFRFGKNFVLTSGTDFKTNNLIKMSFLQVLLIAIIVAMFINDTSQFFMIEDVEGNCRRFWWRNLLMIQNLFPKDEICMTWSWYVAADFQLFIAASILLALSVK